MKHWYSYPELLSREYLEKAISKRRRASEIAPERGWSRYSVYTAVRHHGLSMEGIRSGKVRFLRRKVG
mgnify:CR=1 FL=1